MSEAEGARRNLNHHRHTHAHSVDRGRSKMRQHAKHKPTNNITSSSATDTRSRSSREVMVDMKTMLEEAEAVKAMLREAEATNAEAEADLRGSFARSKGQVGSSSSLVNSVDDHPLMDVLGGTDARGSNESVSVEDVDGVLNDVNRRRLQKATKSSVRTSLSRNFSGSRSLDGGGSPSNRISTRDPRGRRRRSSTRPIDDSDEDDGDKSSPPAPSSHASDSFHSRSSRSRDDTSICVEPSEFINLKVELASVKANNEVLYSKTRVLTEENCMLRTELCSSKASEAELRQMAANLEKQVSLLKKQNGNGQERENSGRRHQVRRDSDASISSTISAFGKAFETLLASEINGAKDSDFSVPLGAAISVPTATEETPSLARRLCRSLSKESLDDVPFTNDFGLTSEDNATAQQEQLPPSRPPRRARRRGSNASNFSVDDAVTVQCELNNLADENDDLREKNAALEAERNRLRERLDQMMAVSAATASAVPADMGTVGGNTEYELHGKDFEQAYNDSYAPQAPPSSIRDFMTKVSNNISGNTAAATPVGPMGRHRRSMGSNSQGSSLPPSRFVDLQKRGSVHSMLSVDSLLWDSFNDDGVGHLNSARNDAAFSSVPEIDDEDIERQEADITRKSGRTSTDDGEDDSTDLVEQDDRLGLDDYQAYDVNSDSLRLRHGTAA